MVAALTQVTSLCNLLFCNLITNSDVIYYSNPILFRSRRSTRGGANHYWSKFSSEFSCQTIYCCFHLRLLKNAWFLCFRLICSDPALMRAEHSWGGIFLRCSQTECNILWRLRNILHTEQRLHVPSFGESSFDKCKIFAARLDCLLFIWASGNSMVSIDPYEQ